MEPKVHGDKLPEAESRDRNELSEGLLSPAAHGSGNRNVIRRLIAHFSLRLVLAAVLFVAMAVFIFCWMQMKLLDIESGRSFAQAGVLKLIDTMQVDEAGVVHFDEGLLERVKSEGGWLQMLDEQGNVTYSLFTPDDVPTAYKPAEFVAYWKKQMPFPYDLAVWIREKNGIVYTLLYGVVPEEKRLLRAVLEAADAKEQSLELRPDLAERIKQADAAVQLLDPSGRQLGAYGRSEALPSQYSLQELALRSIYSDRYGYKLAFDFDERTGNAWVVSIPLRSKGELGGFLQKDLNVMVFSLGSLLLSGMLLFLLLSLWYANRFGTPVLHMIDWLKQLGKAEFREPGGRWGPRSLDPKGRLRRRYRLFADVFLSLSRLSEHLRRNEDMRAKLEQTREEWITGVSHDLKTPLTSIKGYSHMLEAPDYGWSTEEVREFAAVIRDKAHYMELLIDDLSLTYRLQNEALPMDLRETELNGFADVVIRRFQESPAFSSSHVAFRPALSPLCCRADERWLSRALENLLANAVLHNPEGTEVVVSIMEETESARIEVRDNGSGMDEETVGRLFERYYRGTNTEGESGGTGLGMAIARQIVLALGGDIRVESEPGKGTAVSILLQQVKGN